MRLERERDRIITSCATVIQTKWRFYRDRRKFLEAKRAVIILQATARGFLVRQRYRKVSLQNARKNRLRDILLPNPKQMLFVVVVCAADLLLSCSIRCIRHSLGG